MSKKIKPELLNAIEDQQRTRFLEAHNKMTEELIETYQMALVPIIKYSERGIIPAYAIQKIDKNAISNKPETDGPTDSDNQAPKE
jgi:hypothetical protein